MDFASKYRQSISGNWKEFRINTPPQASVQTTLTSVISLDCNSLGKDFDKVSAFLSSVSLCHKWE